MEDDYVKIGIEKRGGSVINIIEKYKQTTFKVLKTLSLEMFDTREYKNDFYWREMFLNPENKVEKKAFALNLNGDMVTWQPCIVKGIAITDDDNGSNNVYQVSFQQVADNNNTTDNTKDELIHRLFICFEEENIEAYCDRFCFVVSEFETARESMALNLYIDCMPVDGIKGLDSEQINRILNQTLNMDCLKRNSMLDSSSLVQQYNLCHMRTINKLTFINLMEKQTKSVVSANPFSMNSNSIKNNSSTNIIFPSHKNKQIIIPRYLPLMFQDNKKAFHVASLWNKTENIAILLSIQADNLKIENSTFFNGIEKTLRVEEFVANQNAAITVTTQAICETWPTSVMASVKQNLQNIKKVCFVLFLET